jgi:hypothetical protein
LGDLDGIYPPIHPCSTPPELVVAVVVVGRHDRVVAVKGVAHELLGGHACRRVYVGCV